MGNLWFDCAAQSKNATFAANFRPFDFRLAICFVLGYSHQASLKSKGAGLF
jgi:hypothetical protein